MWFWRKMEKIRWTDREKNYKYYIESMRKEISYTKKEEGLTELATSCVEIAF
jgi:hypothetical protein